MSTRRVRRGPTPSRSEPPWAVVRERAKVLVPAGASVLTLILFACTWGPRPDTPAQPLPPQDLHPHVRIALIESAPTVTVTLEGPWEIDPDNGSRQIVEDGGKLTIRPDGQFLVLEGELVSLRLRGTQAVAFRPFPYWSSDPDQVPGLLLVDGRRYRGELTVKRLEGGGLRAINAVGIEDYLSGVIGHEMPIRWSDAALQAQTIAARTYALTNLKPRQDHDLKADTRSQVYSGVIGEDDRARQLVAQTRGQVVAHGGELIVTYYHSTCGGDTVPAKWVFPWVKEDSVPLSGATGCTCQPSRYFRWSKDVQLGGDDAVRGLVVKLPLKEVVVTHWPRGQYVKQVAFTGADGNTTTVSGWDARSLFGLRGYAFDIQLQGDGESLAITGRGWGHGVGMCQFGAEGFAKQGLNARQILAHFYPGTTVETLGY